MSEQNSPKPIETDNTKAKPCLRRTWTAPTVILSRALAESEHLIGPNNDGTGGNS